MTGTQLVLRSFAREVQPGTPGRFVRAAVQAMCGQPIPDHLICDYTQLVKLRPLVAWGEIDANSVFGFPTGLSRAERRDEALDVIDAQIAELEARMVTR